jgi:hypothetical protein
MLFESSFSITYDKNGHPVMDAAIINQSGNMMKVLLKMDEKNEFIGIMHFYTTGSKADAISLPSNELKDLAKSYNSLVYQKLDNYQQQKKSNSHKIPSSKSIFLAIKNTMNIKKVIGNLFNSLTVTNIFTIDGFSHNTLAKTTMRNRSKLFTVVHPDYMQHVYSYLSLLQMHNCNIYAVNTLFISRLEKITSDIGLAINSIRVISIAMWLIINIITFISSHVPCSISYLDITIYILKFLVIPYILHMAISRILQYVINYRLKILLLELERNIDSHGKF